jgi:hypothetical protein
MKYFICTLATVAISLSAMSARAGDQIPTSTLSDMGLSGMTVISDREASNVRGMGAFAGGISWTTVGLFDNSAGSINVYAARGKYEASGNNASIGGVVRFRIKDVDTSDGSSSREIRVRGYVIGAGGFSNARAF